MVAWTPEVDSKLLMCVMKQMHASINYPRLASDMADMGVSVTPKACTHRIAKIKAEAGGNPSNGTKTSVATPKKRVATPGTRTPKKTASATKKRDKRSDPSCSDSEAVDGADADADADPDGEWGVKSSANTSPSKRKKRDQEKPTVEQERGGDGDGDDDDGGGVKREYDSDSSAGMKIDLEMFKKAAARAGKTAWNGDDNDDEAVV